MRRLTVLRSCSAGIYPTAIRSPIFRSSRRSSRTRCQRSRKTNSSSVCSTSCGRCAELAGIGIRLNGLLRLSCALSCRQPQPPPLVCILLHDAAPRCTNKKNEGALVADDFDAAKPNILDCVRSESPSQLSTSDNDSDSEPVIDAVVPPAYAELVRELSLARAFSMPNGTNVAKSKGFAPPLRATHPQRKASMQGSHKGLAIGKIQRSTSMRPAVRCDFSNERILFIILSFIQVSQRSPVEDTVPPSPIRRARSRPSKVRHLPDFNV